MASLMQLTNCASFIPAARREAGRVAPLAARRTTAAGKLTAALLLGCLGLATAGCASDGQSTEELYHQGRGDRYYHTNLYEEPTSGVQQYQRGRTSRVEGHSPLTANIFMLNAEQKAAIDALKRMREQREENAF